MIYISTSVHIMLHGLQSDTRQQQIRRERAILRFPLLLSQMSHFRFIRNIGCSLWCSSYLRSAHFNSCSSYPLSNLNIYQITTIWENNNKQFHWILCIPLLSVTLFVLPLSSILHNSRMFMSNLELSRTYETSLKELYNYVILWDTHTDIWLSILRSSSPIQFRKRGTISSVVTYFTVANRPSNFHLILTNLKKKT